MPGIIGNTGAERSSAWIWDFSSTHSTNAFSGGSTYSPTTSRTLSMNCGSVDSLNVSTWCGLSLNAFQIRPTVERLRPLWAAIDARDQCVASVGVRSKVDTTTCSICASVIFRGAPGRGSSESPSNRDSTNRRRHVPTVCGHTPNSAATCLFAFPSAQPSTIRLRNARACDDFARRDQRSNVSRSSSVNTTSATGRPVRATPAPYTCGPDFRRRTLDHLLGSQRLQTSGWAPSAQLIGRRRKVGEGAGQCSQVVV